MYHRIAKVNRQSSTAGHYVSPLLFASQLRALKLLGYKAISLREAIETWQRGEDTPPKSFAITFDDGCRNVYTNALPILRKLRFPSTVFLVSDLIGKTNEWNAAEGDVEEPLMSLEEIRECRSAGMEFGSHTLRHCDLKTAEPDEAWSEISQSKSDIESLLGCECPLFCFPYGGWRAETREMVIKAGYRAACSTIKGSNDSKTDRFLLKRINIRRDSILPVFLYKVWRGVARDQ